MKLIIFFLSIAAFSQQIKINPFTGLPDLVGASGGGTTYTAGAGITLPGNAITADTSVLLSRATAQAGTSVYCRSTTGSAAYTCSLTPALTAYTTGSCLVLNADFANVTTATLNVDTVGVASILRKDGALSAADVPLNKPVIVCHDGTNFILQGSGSGGGGATTTSLYRRWNFGSCDTTGGFNVTWTDNFSVGTATTSGCIGPSLVASRVWSNTVTNTHYVQLLLPDNWNSGAAVDLKTRSWMGAGSGNVRWNISTKCYAGTEDWTSMSSFNAAQTTSTVAFDGTNNTGTATLSSVTMTGCAAGETLAIKIERDNTVGSNLAAGAGIIAVEAKYGITL